MTPWYTDHDLILYQGHVLDVLPTLEPESVNCVVTSPPYYGLRDYGVDGQIGLEPSPVEYVEALREVFAEVRRVLRPDGTLWLNLGDSYYSGKGSPTQPDIKNEARRPPARVLDMPGKDWAKPKDLLGVPWRVAFALQDDGWTLRNDIIWHKPNAMPESVTDRLSTRYEHVFLFTRSRRYWFNLDAIREPHQTPPGKNYGPGRADRATGPMDRNGHSHSERTAEERNADALHPLGKNPGDMWSINTQPYPGAHFATMPPKLARRCVLAGCPQTGVVLDPFAGSGTTLMVARSELRDSVGIELAPGNCAQIVDRIGQPVLDFDFPAEDAATS